MGTAEFSHGRLRARLILAYLVTYGLSLAAELGTYQTQLFSGPDNCAFCHDQWGNALLDKRGNDVSITSDWRATMMAHSFRDPLWRAVMEAEVLENPSLQGFIENKCQTCHAPAARVQVQAEGTNQLSFEVAKASLLAPEGVGCTVCHQIQSTNLGTQASFTGQFTITDERRIFGPYDEVVTMPMQRHVDYTPEFGMHVQESGLCASCHTLFTPVVDSNREIRGSFPEQVPYLEWRASAYARKGKHCQDCHMPQLSEQIKISARPPWLEGRSPFWRHQFAGGNAFMLSMLSQNAEECEANAEPEHFQQMINYTREQLNKAARIRLNGKRQRDSLALRVHVQNLTGHKFPTGHPYRRAWLHVSVLDKKGVKIFESGGVDAKGHIAGSSDGHAPHLDEITQGNQVQIYQGSMVDSQQRPTWSLLRAAAYAKDNRIPPKGFKPNEEDLAFVGIHGVGNDANFNRNGSGEDEVTYRIPLTSRDPVSVHVRLLYQSVPPEAVARLSRSPGTEARAFLGLYQAMEKRPEVVQEVRAKL